MKRKKSKGNPDLSDENHGVGVGMGVPVGKGVDVLSIWVGVGAEVALPEVVPDAEGLHSNSAAVILVAISGRLLI